MSENSDQNLMFRFLNEIGIIAQLSGNALEKVMPDGMTMPQFTVLNHLTRLGGNRTPLQIANAMQVTKGAMTNTLGHLERAHLITVVPDAKDGRSKRVDITDSGRRAHAMTIAALGPEFAYLSDMFPDSRLKEALPLLEDLRKVLDARRN